MPPPINLYGAVSAALFSLRLVHRDNSSGKVPRSPPLRNAVYAVNLAKVKTRRIHRVFTFLLCFALYWDSSAVILAAVVLFHRFVGVHFGPLVGYGVARVRDELHGLAEIISTDRRSLCEAKSLEW